ncbi:hypothetical protein DICVIV_09156 [Dictyocaulus viviparus]|uniref:Uncharacterized protein n=1 Tax=Dictyocaulus viviparus TaxID=29172 RepID=A0A0D8XJN3_DICVI|nr:hypothetical protein DICVIV_09156 [Dictyocaulus viviparus]
MDSDDRTDDNMGKATNDEDFLNVDANILTMEDQQLNKEGIDKYNIETKQAKEKEPEGSQDEDKNHDFPNKNNVRLEEDPAREQKNTTLAPAENPSKLPEVLRIPLNLKTAYSDIHIMDVDDIKAARRILEQFEKLELYARERVQAKNDLESYAIEVDQLIEEDMYIKHSTETERRQLHDKVRRFSS